MHVHTWIWHKSDIIWLSKEQVLKSSDEWEKFLTSEMGSWRFMDAMVPTFAYGFNPPNTRHVTSVNNHMAVSRGSYFWTRCLRHGFSGCSNQGPALFEARRSRSSQCFPRGGSLWSTAALEQHPAGEGQDEIPQSESVKPGSAIVTPLFINSRYSRHVKAPQKDENLYAITKISFPPSRTFKNHGLFKLIVSWHLQTWRAPSSYVCRPNAFPGPENGGR